MFTLTGCNSDPEDLVRPIQGFTEFWDIFVYPMAGIMWVIGKTIGFGNYPLTIILSTLIVRTIGMIWTSFTLRYFRTVSCNCLYLLTFL